MPRSPISVMPNTVLAPETKSEAIFLPRSAMPDTISANERLLPNIPAVIS